MPPCRLSLAGPAYACAIMARAIEDSAGARAWQSTSCGRSHYERTGCERQHSGLVRADRHLFATCAQP